MDALELQAVRRTLIDLTSRFNGSELTQALDDFGWDEVFQSDPLDAVDALFSAQGHAGSWSSALHDVLAATAILPRNAKGRTAVLIPEPGSDSSGMPDGAISGLLVGARPEFEAVLVFSGRGVTSRLYRIQRDRLSFNSLHGLDDRLPVQRVCSELVNGELVVEGAQANRWWSAVIANGRRALCFELCGTMEAMIDLAVTHATDRHQFGRPVGSFQAVRHRLAESRVAVTGAHSAARASLDHHEPVVASMAAKVVTGRAQRLVAAHCQQVLAGVGFTAEHPFHRFMFRATALDRLFGSSTELATELGGVLVDRGEPVRLAEL